MHFSLLFFIGFVFSSASAGCDEKDIALTDLASIAVMKSNGWKFDFGYPNADNNGVGKHCVANGQKAKWFGWTYGNTAGTLSATFTGYGEVTVDFGNCWSGGNVKLYKDSTLIATAPVGTKSKIAKFLFSPGSVLKLKDEDDGDAVVMLNSVSVNCDDVQIEGCDCSDKTETAHGGKIIGQCVDKLQGKFWCYIKNGAKSTCPDKKPSRRGDQWWSFIACEWYDVYVPIQG